MLTKIKRFIFGCKHEWRLIDSRSWNPFFGGANTTHDYGCENCGETARKSEEDLAKWKFEQTKKGATFIDEEIE